MHDTDEWRSQHATSAHLHFVLHEAHFVLHEAHFVFHEAHFVLQEAHQFYRHCCSSPPASSRSLPHVTPAAYRHLSVRPWRHWNLSVITAIAVTSLWRTSGRRHCVVRSQRCCITRKLVSMMHWACLFASCVLFFERYFSEIHGLL